MEVCTQHLVHASQVAAGSPAPSVCPFHPPFGQCDPSGQESIHSHLYSSSTKCPTWCVPIKCWLHEWLNKRCCAVVGINVTTIPQSGKCIFSHNTMPWVSSFPGLSDSSKTSILICFYFTTLCLLLSQACPSWFQSGCSSSRHSILHIRPNIRQEEEEHFEV